MNYNKPSTFHYKLAQMVSWVVAKFIFKRKFIRNEIKDQKGPFVVIANHEAVLDFANLIGATKHPMSFVISSAFFNTLPLKKFMTKMGVIPKAQFQTSMKDLRQMVSVIKNEGSIAIYPAGLMCEDGLSTPIPQATYKFLKILNADVYVAKTIGTYFVMPKWAKGISPGRTYMDIYKLFSKEELAEADEAAIKAKTDEALLFDAYREQEQYLAKYKSNRDLNGLENVLYVCPYCKTEFSIQVKDKNVLQCSECGLTYSSDIHGFLHKESCFGPDIRYVSDWSKSIHNDMKAKIEQRLLTSLTAETKILMINFAKNKFIEVGSGTISLSVDELTIDGVINGESINLSIPTAHFPTLPFKPGKHLDIQNGADIYRCVLRDGKMAMKFIHMIKSIHELKKGLSGNRQF